MQLSTPVTESFAAEASGLDLRQPIDAETAAEIEEAMDKYAVLVWRVSLDDDQHMAFTKWFGPLDMGLLNVTKKPNRFNMRASWISPMSASTARSWLATTRSLRRWQTSSGTDSSFMETVAKYSLLSARVVPETGGTGVHRYACRLGRAAGRPADHGHRSGRRYHPLYSRILLGFISDEQMASIPPARPLVRTRSGVGIVYADPCPQDRGHEHGRSSRSGERTDRTRHAAAIRSSADGGR